MTILEDLRDVMKETVLISDPEEKLALVYSTLGDKYTMKEINGAILMIAAVIAFNND